MQHGNVDTLALGFENVKQSARINVKLSSTDKRDKHIVAIDVIILTLLATKFIMEVVQL